MKQFVRLNIIRVVQQCAEELNSKLNPLDSKGNYSVIPHYTKLIHWLLMGGLLHLVQRGGAWVGCGPTQAPPHCTINTQCINHCIAI